MSKISLSQVVVAEVSPPTLSLVCLCEQLNLYLCFTFLALRHWLDIDLGQKEKEMRRLTTVFLSLADHLYPLKVTTVSGETANIADSHLLIFLFIGNLRKALWWFISVISSRECFFPSLCSVAMRPKDEWFSFEHWQVTCRPRQWRAALKCKCKGGPAVPFQSTQITTMGIVQEWARAMRRQKEGEIERGRYSVSELRCLCMRFVTRSQIGVTFLRVLQTAFDLVNEFKTHQSASWDRVM